MDLPWRACLRVGSRSAVRGARGSFSSLDLSRGEQCVTEPRSDWQGEQRVLEMIAAGAPLADSLAMLVRVVEEHSPPVMGSVLLVSADGSQVVHGAGPNLPPDYMRGIDGSPIGPRAGSNAAAQCAISLAPSSSRRPTLTSIPQLRSRSTPPPATSGFGSMQATTTRTRPAATMASTHGAVRP